MWEFINSITGKSNKNKTKNNIINLDKDGIRLTDDQEIADCFNDFFTNIGSNLANDINNSQSNILQLPDFNSNSFLLLHTDKDEISKLFANLPNKTGGVDGINSRTLKVIKDYISEPFAYIINLSIDKSTWPLSLKQSEVVPIYKAGNRNDSSNYRPISLIS